MKILHIDSSILGGASVSRQLSAEIAARLKATHPGAEVTYRDIGAHPLPHLSGAVLAAAQGPQEVTGELAQDLKTGGEVLAEFMAADAIVIGAPMYNFGVSSQLKAWIDRIAVAGKTFRYTEKGPEGLAGAKKVFLALSRGGFYGPDSGMNAFEHQESHLKAVFTFLGIREITFVAAEGLNISADQKAASLQKAASEIAALAA
ncbi:MAG: FMN-dependent NADH-azoreductase [Rhodospirillaceae bacterium]|nr:FMN-dependent NADH-azoreductase [Rhodospirillaceae bacterium]